MKDFLRNAKALRRAFALALCAAMLLGMFGGVGLGSVTAHAETDVDAFARAYMAFRQEYDTEAATHSNGNHVCAYQDDFSVFYGKAAAVYALGNSEAVRTDMATELAKLDAMVSAAAVSAYVSRVDAFSTQVSSGKYSDLAGFDGAVAGLKQFDYNGVSMNLLSLVTSDSDELMQQQERLDGIRTAFSSGLSSIETTVGNPSDDILTDGETGIETVVGVPGDKTDGDTNDDSVVSDEGIEWFVGAVSDIALKLDTNTFDGDSYEFVLALRDAQAKWDVLSDEQKNSPEGLATKAALDKMWEMVSIPEHILSFLDAGYALIDGIENGMDEDELSELSGRVMEMFGNLTESDLAFPGVSDLIKKLVSILGLEENPFDSVPYNISLRWVDTGSDCELSDNGSTGFWTGSNDGIAAKLQMTITFNTDVSKDDFRIEIPENLIESDALPIVYDSTKNHLISGPQSCVGSVSGLALLVALSKDDILKIDDTDMEDIVDGNPVSDGIITITAKSDIPGGMKMTIPMTLSWYLLNASGDIVDVSNDVAIYGGKGEGQISDNLSRSFSLKYSTQFSDLVDLRVRKNNSSSNITLNQNPLVTAWVPNIEKYYGVSKDTFDSEVEAGYSYFEYPFVVNAINPNNPCLLEFTVNPAQSGTTEGVYISTGNSTETDTYYRMHGRLYPKENWISNTPATLSMPWSTCWNQFDSYSDNVVLSMLDTAKSNFGYSSDMVVWVLVKYLHNDVYDADANTFSASCSIDVKLSNVLTGKNVEQSLPINVSFSPTVVESTGKVYALDVGNWHYTEANNTAYLNVLALGCDMSGFLMPNIRGMYKNTPSDNATNSVLAMDAMTIYDVGTDASDRGYKVLGPGDYELRNVLLSICPGALIYNDTDTLVDVDVDTNCLDDEVDIYVTTWDSPNTWVYDKTVCVRDFYDVNVFIQNNAKLVSLNNEHVLRVKLEYKNRSTPLYMQIYTNILFHGQGDVISQACKNYYDSDYVDQGRIYAYASLFDLRDGKSVITKNADYISSDSRDIINSLSEVLYSDILDEGKYPFRNFNAKWAGRSSLSTDIFSIADIYTGDFDEPVCPGIAPTFSNREYGYNNVTRIDYWFGGTLNIGGGSYVTVPSIVDGSPLLYDTAKFFIVIPENAEVVDVLPGRLQKTEGAAFYPFSMTNNMSSVSFMNFMPTVEYEIIDDFEIGERYFTNTNRKGPCQLLVVTSKLPYDRSDANLIKQIGNASLFGNFTVSLCPKYFDEFMSLDETLLDVRFSVVETDKPGEPFMEQPYGHCIWDFLDDFGDFTQDGKTSAQIVKHSSAAIGIEDGSYISGLQLAARGSEGMWGRGVSIEPGDAYAYRLTYSQVAERSKNVVLFDSIEDVANSSWTGEPVSLDTSFIDKFGLSYHVYGNQSRVDSQVYVNGGANSFILTAENGWYELNPTDRKLDVSLWDLSGYESVAIDFGDTEFDARTNTSDSWAQDTDGVVYEIESMRARIAELEAQKENATLPEEAREMIEREISSLNEEIERIKNDSGVSGGTLSGRPSMAVVYVNMQSPDDGYGPGDNMVYNRAFFNDVLLTGSDASDGAMTSNVSVNVHKDVPNYWMPITGGPGVMMFTAVGLALLAAAAAVVIVRRRRSR